jgi:hypothetical protein
MSENITTEQQAGEPQFQALDARVVALWRLTDAFWLGVFLLSLLASELFWVWRRPGWWLWLVVAWAVLVVACAWFVLWYPSQAYRAWGYRVDARVLETRHGVFFRQLQLLPLTRLQHVDLERGPLERRFGLASLVLHTAGTHSASIRIPGLAAAEAQRLRDYLVEIGGDDAV